jgi:hypothetical protein
MWAHFKPGTVELLNPTYDPASTLRKLSFKNPRNKDYLKSWKFQSSKIASGKSKKRNPQDQEAASNGKLSSVTGAVAHLADTVSANVPVLTPLSKPLGWVANVATRALSAFGLAKPGNEAGPQMMFTKLATNPLNVDGLDYISTTGFTAGNKLQHDPRVLPCDYDEMAFDNILTRFAYWESVLITTSTTADGVIYSVGLNPANFVTAATTVGAYNVLPAGLFSKLFKCWRGDLMMRLKFVKTKYHNCTLVVAYYPGVIGTVSDPDNTQWVTREIIDLQAGEEWTYRFAFANQYCYMPVGDNYGRVVVAIQTPLTCPDTASNTVEMLVEWAVAPGSEWIQPNTVPLICAFQSPALDKNNRHRTNPPTISASALPVKKEKDRDETSEWVMQSNDSELCRQHESGVFNAQQKFTDFQMDTAATCVGERLMSLRQLLKLGTTIQDFASGVGSINVRTWTPDVIQTSVSSNKIYDYFNVFSPLFRFRRGGMGVRGYGWTTAMSPFTGLFTRSTVPSSTLFATSTPTSPLAVQYKPMEPMTGFDIGLPSWQCAPIVLNKYDGVDTTIEPQLFVTNSLLMYPHGGTVSVTWTRYVRDDFSLHYYIGVPPLSIA